MRWALPVAMMAVLSGCATVEDPFLTGSVAQGSGLAPALTQDVSAHYALASLTSAVGAPRAVRQTAQGGENTIRQVIVYANTTRLAGENTLIVEGGRGSDGRYRRAPSRNQLTAEMARAMPGVAMTISPVIGQNAYGVYGYATGSYGGGSCLYGWQVANTGGAGRGLSASGYPAQVRLRFCDDRISQERISTLMQSLSIKPLTGSTITMLRGMRGHAAGEAPVYGADALFDAPSPQNAALASVEPQRPAHRPVAQAARSAPVARSPIVAEEIASPVIVNAATVPMPVMQGAGQKVVTTSEQPVPAVSEKTVAEAWSMATAKMAQQP